MDRTFKKIIIIILGIVFFPFILTIAIALRDN